MRIIDDHLDRQVTFLSKVPPSADIHCQWSSWRWQYWPIRWDFHSSSSKQRSSYFQNHFNLTYFWNIIKKIYRDEEMTNSLKSSDDLHLHLRTSSSRTWLRPKSKDNKQKSTLVFIIQSCPSGKCERDGEKCSTTWAIILNKLFFFLSSVNSIWQSCFFFCSCIKPKQWFPFIHFGQSFDITPRGTYTFCTINIHIYK